MTGAAYRSSNMGPVLIMAGGTGGHVFPALAVAERLRGLGVAVVWMGTRRGLEARVVPGAGFPLDCISVSGLRGKGVVRWLSAPFMLLWAFLQACRVLLERRPRAVLGLGGFVTGPGGVGAWVLRRPLLIHEQNAIAGLTNRLLARLADRVMEAFPGTFPAARRALCTGNPVRAAIAALPVPEIRMSGRTGRLRLLVLGGSLGARALNEVLPRVLAALAEDVRPEVWHQTGEAHLQDSREGYRKAGLEVSVVAFIEDMAQAYGWADLVLCRAGALTVAELAAAGVGAILVPYPFAVDDHQTGNAHYLSDAGAAVLVQQPELGAERLAALIAGFAADRTTVLAMARAARALARLDATEDVVRQCLQAEGGTPAGPVLPGGCTGEHREEL